MKIKREDYEKLKEAIKKVIEKHGVEKILKYREQLKDDSRIKDLDTRFVWDLFYATGLRIADRVWEPGDIELYSYLNDTHITTALKLIVKELLGSRISNDSSIEQIVPEKKTIKLSKSQILTENLLKEAVQKEKRDYQKTNSNGAQPAQAQMQPESKEAYEKKLIEKAVSSKFISEEIEFFRNKKMENPQELVEPDKSSLEDRPLPEPVSDEKDGYQEKEDATELTGYIKQGLRGLKK